MKKQRELSSAMRGRLVGRRAAQILREKELEKQQSQEDKTEGERRDAGTTDEAESRPDSPKDEEVTGG